MSDSTRRSLDALDIEAYRILKIDDYGTTVHPDNPTPHEIKIVGRWQSRQHDPAFRRLGDVARAREKRGEETWYQKLGFSRLAALLCVVGLGFLGFIRPASEATLGMAGVFLAMYFFEKITADILDARRDITEDQIIREWELHSKMDRLYWDVQELIRQAETKRAASDGS